MKQNDFFYCLAGISPSSGLYEVRKGISASTDLISVESLNRGSLEFEEEIDDIKFIFPQHLNYLCLIKFLYSGSQTLLRFNADFTEHTVIEASGFDLAAETLAFAEAATHSGWRLLLQVAKDQEG
jgi:hypothetical protein